ncbi:MAG: nucleoside triphosphate pyrophosphohydrolase [Firmicutes bacterium]|nr:nucleoside triphosphate pyrophosphohydrolase [Bacillota bacterium]
MFYNKLIRDGIPSLIELAGKGYRIRTLDHDEYSARLNEKLDEEVSELHRTETPSKALEELADILEVLYALATVHGYTRQDLEAAYSRKHAERGGFDKRILLIEADE